MRALCEYYLDDSIDSDITLVLVGGCGGSIEGLVLQQKIEGNKFVHAAQSSMYHQNTGTSSLEHVYLIE
jgi:hypothetical protein